MNSSKPEHRYYPAGKRAFDLVLLVVSSPVWLTLLMVVALALRCFQGKGFIFRQRRPGLAGAPFALLKFRTMTSSNGETDELTPDERRLTKFGKFLRRSSLDELPELINVLQGDMSLVGPRPLLVQYLERYSPEQARRHEVEPGITGWAQVNGRNALTWSEKFELDIWYVDNMSLWLDLKILALTLWKVITGEGLSAPGHATMPEFMGDHDE